jgi:isopenicillin N synthase-like dioxygenase
MPANIWPDAPEGFRETFTALYAEFDRIGARILSHIAVWLGLGAGWFAPAIADGNSILRLLHYPPITDAAGDAIRAGAHEDINLITLLLGAEEAGLELLTREGRWIPATPPPGALVVNIGDMLQRLTNHVLPSTTHRVVNPAPQRAGFPRYSMPFFMHPTPETSLAVLENCVGDGAKFEPVTAGAFLDERLRAIGLRK